MLQVKKRKETGGHALDITFRYACACADQSYHSSEKTDNSFISSAYHISQFHFLLIFNIKFRSFELAAIPSTKFSVKMTLPDQNEQQPCLTQPSETGTAEEADEENAPVPKTPADHHIQITTTITNVAVQSSNEAYTATIEHENDEEDAITEAETTGDYYVYNTGDDDAEHDETGSAADQQQQDAALIRADTTDPTNGIGTSKKVRRRKQRFVPRRIWVRSIFHKIGSLISRWPGPFFCIGLLISLLSVGMLRIELKDRIRQGYTPDDAPSMEETRAMREFWNSTDEPLITVVLIQSKIADRSMLDVPLLQEARQLQHFLMAEFNCSTGPNERFKFKDLCGDQCAAIQMPFQLYVDSLSLAVKHLKQNPNSSVQKALDGEILDYPHPILYRFYFLPIPFFPYIWPYKQEIPIRLETLFFGVKLRNGTNSNDGTNPTALSPEQRLTNMDRVELILLLFRADEPTTAEKNHKLATWQLAVADYIDDGKHKSDSLEVHVVGSEILNREMLREGQRTIPFFASGFAIMFTFVFVNVLLISAYIHRPRQRIGLSRVWISFATVLSPCLAITTTYGILAFVGQRFNSFLLILPYLVLGIGVDDGFLLIHKWDSTGQLMGNPGARLAFVLAEVGPSITVTTLTNVISFAIGAFMPTPEVRIFCRGAAIALSLVYLLQLLILCPVLCWIGQHEQKKQQQQRIKSPIENEQENGNAKMESNEEKQTQSKPARWRRFVDGYCRLLIRPQFAGCLCAILCAYWAFSITGAILIESSLNSSKIIPRNSPLQKPVKLLDQIVWNDYFAVILLVNSPMNLSNHEQVDQFWEAINEFEGLPNSKGKNFTFLWLRDYQIFLHKNKQKFDGCNLQKFLIDLEYQFWASFIRLRNDGEKCPIIEKSTAILTYSNTGTWDKRIDLVVTLREIATRHSQANDGQLQLVVWEQNGMFVDQMLSLKKTIIETALITLSCMAIICVLFTPNPFSVLISLLSICSISIGVFGQFYWLGYDLDPIVMAAFLMSIGLSVDFCAHIVYHFQFEHREELLVMDETGGSIIAKQVPLNSRLERVEFVLGTVAWPMLQSGLSTMLCICPLFAIQSYAGNVFIVTIFLVCTLGLCHGLLVLPCFLSMLPRCCTTAQIYSRLVGPTRSMIQSCRATMSRRPRNTTAATNNQ